MKALRRFFTVTVLTIVLAHVALGEEGVIHPGIIPPPPPSPYTNGVIHPGSAAPGTELGGEDATIDLAMEMTLTLVQNLLALF
jgi:hypothetical protein